MQTIDIHDAQARFIELVESLSPSDAVLITRGDRPVARLTPADERPSLRDIRPSSVGELLRPFPSPDDDILGEMLDR